MVQASNLSYCTQLKSLTLGDGTVLTFMTNDIPDPPTASSEFLDIVKLNVQWDDMSPDWQGTAFLCIKDRPIAMKYWPIMYCHTKDPQKCKQRQGTKNNWCKWKVGIARYAVLIAAKLMGSCRMSSSTIARALPNSSGKSSARTGRG